VGGVDVVGLGAWCDNSTEDEYREELAGSVGNVVLSDDAEETEEEHPWPWLTERLGGLGVGTTPEELRGLPYEVILSRRLRARLSTS